MAQSNYTKSLTGAAVLLVLLGTSLCEARRLRQFTTINSNFMSNPNVPVVGGTQSLLDSILQASKDQILAEQAAVDSLNANGGQGRRLFNVQHGEVESKGGSFVSTAGKGSASTSSETTVAVSPSISKADGSGGKRAGAATTLSTKTSASTGEVGSTVSSGEDILHTGVKAAEDSGEPTEHVLPGAGTGNPRFQTGSFGSSKETATEVVESEVSGASKDASVVSDEPVPAGTASLLSHFSGSGVSIDLGTSSTSRGARISATSRTSGSKSASSSLGLSVGSSKKPHEALVPVPASVETGEE